MRYLLPDGELIDLGIYSISDCVPVEGEEDTQELLSSLLFGQTGVLIASSKGGDSNE